MLAKTKLDEAKYLMAGGVPKSALYTPNAKSKKRAVDSSDDEDISVQQPPAKKQRNGQKAHLDSVQVPIDSGCPLASE